MIKKLLRIVLTLCGALIGYGVSFLFISAAEMAEFKYITTMPEKELFLFRIGFVAAFAIIFFIFSPALSKKSESVATEFESDLQKISATDFLAGSFGLVIGLLLAAMISQVYVTITIPFLPTALSVLTYLILGYLGVFISTRKGKDIINTLAISRKNPAARSKQKTGDASPKILDTSVIIDGRISDIMKTGFIEGNIVIPEFVLNELRHIADSSDNLKRNRGRRGLDVLNKIQKEYGVDIYNTSADKAIAEIPEVDVKLLKLAQMINGKVVTNDFNLNKVAMIKGVSVLNINELANSLKPVVLPGEEINLFIVKEGRENNQGVAYLDDGTMIVVEEGRRYIGETITAIVTSVLQTAAGRMIFAKPKKGNN